MIYDIVRVRLDGVPKIPYKDGVGKHRGVCAHATANYGSGEKEDTAMNERNYEQNTWQSAFVHYFCDYTTILDVADDDYISYGCGKGNPYYINVELCQTKRADRFIESYNRWIFIMAKVLHDNKLGVIDGVTLVSHKWVSDNLGGNHQDPHAYIESHGKVWSDVVSDVKRVYAELEGQSKGENNMKPVVIKERVYAENGVLKQAHKADGSSDYSKSATDVRYIKFNKDTFKLKLVWAKGKTVSQLVKENNADYGFNFPFFHETTFDPIADCKIGNTILNRGYDTPNGAQQTKWHGFAYKNGQPVIGQFNVNDDFGSDGFLVKTTPLLLNGQGSEVWDWYRVQDGTASDIGKSGNSYVRAQRTVVGLDASGNLHLAVGDGRTKYDRGLDLQEMALYMKSKGCVWALNGDGGGSSVISSQLGSLGQNKDSDERVVHHAILVYLKEEEKVDPLKLQRDKFAEMDNQIEYMKDFIDGSGSGTEKWALSYLEQVYDIMLTKKLVKEV